MSNRGLHNFLTEIYSGATKQDIDARINIELAKIKKAFFSPKLSSYNRKKYITKLCFIVLSGVHVCFGLPQIIDLIESKKINAQRIGWMAAVIISGSDSSQVNELMPLIKRHLADTKNENGINFTLSAISSIGSPELAENFGPTIAEIALSTNYADFTRKKALLSLVSFYRCSQLQLIDTIAGRLTPLLCDASYGMRLSVCHLIHTIQIFQPSSIYGVFPQILEILNSFYVKNEYDHDYSTSDIPCSILSAKMIRILSFNTNWNDNEIKLLENIISNILNRSGLKRTEDALISYFAVFEEIAYLALTVPISSAHIDRIFQYMIENINSSILPICFFCLDNLSTFIQFFPHLGSTHQISLQPLYEMMVSQDSELNVRSIQLLYILANKENGLDILTEFLNFIPKAPLNIRILLCQKSALLALCFSVNEKWCIDTLVKLICSCESKLETNLLNSMTIYITGNKERQVYLIQKLYSLLTADFKINFTNQFIELSAYIFGEYSNLIQGEIMVKNIIQQLMLFYHDIKSSDLCKSMIITCFFKLSIKYDFCQKELAKFIKQQQQSLVADVSQRCREYTQLLSIFPNSFLSKFSNTSFQNLRIQSAADILLEKFKNNSKKDKISTSKSSTIISSNFLDKNNMNGNFSTLKSSSSSNNVINASGIIKPNARIDNNKKLFKGDDIIMFDDQRALTGDSENLSLSSRFLNSNKGQIFSNNLCSVSVSFVIFPPNAKVSVFITNNSYNNCLDSSFEVENLKLNLPTSILPSTEKSTSNFNSEPQIFSEINNNNNNNNNKNDEEEEEEEEEEASYSSTTNNYYSNTKEFIIVNNFTISAVNDLKFRIIDIPEDGTWEIEVGKKKEIVVEFVAVGIFDQMPVLTFEVNREIVKTKIPIIFPRWIKEMKMDKATFSSRWNAISDSSQTATISLVIPDGDVMSSVKLSAKEAFGLEPLNIDLPENIIVMCGVFKCLNKSIGFLLRFVYNDSENDLSLTIKTTSPLAIDLLKKRAYSAFVL